MHTIIAATDFSPEGENALEYAGALSRDLDARVVIFNSYSLPPHVANSLFPSEMLHMVAEQNERILDERAAELAAKYDIEVECECSLLLQVQEQLKAIYDKYAADVIVMGAGPATIVQDIFGNTTTSAIMKHYYPVLAVPFDAEYSGINKVLFASDEEKGIHKTVSGYIKALALKLNAEVEIFRVEESVQKLQESTAGSIKTSDEYEDGLEGVPHYYRNVESNVVVKEIEEEIKRIGADLLIMVPHQYGFWQSLIHRSKTRMMASRCEIPLLSIPVHTEK